MKSYTLTIHFGVNYGSALQTWALQYILKKKGVENEVVNYIPAKYKLWNEFIKDKKEKYPKIVIVLAFLVKLPGKYIKRKIFSDFLKKNISLTREISSGKEMKKYCEDDALFIVGSDQVWNFDYNEVSDYTYLFDCIPSTSYKVSYAASIGKSNLEENERKILINYIKDFKFVTVREDKSVEMLRYNGIAAEHVLDPTLLIDRDDWKKVYKKFESKDKFLLIYVMDFLYDDLINIAAKIAKKLNLRIYVASFKKIKDSRIDKQFTMLEPFEFLGLLDAASYVVTNSFHGIAFSLNFNKQFIAVRKLNYNLRIESILRIVGLENRFIEEATFDDSYTELIAYENVNKILNLQRERSNYLLDSMIYDYTREERKC